MQPQSISRGPAVKLIADDREAVLGRMYPNLVRSSREGLCFDDRLTRISPKHFESRFGDLPASLQRAAEILLACPDQDRPRRKAARFYGTVGDQHILFGH